MRLSEAMRLGSMVKPQAFGEMVTDTSACALGAALLAARCQVVRCVVDESERTRPGDRSDLAVVAPDEWAFIVRTGACPACGMSRQVHQVIAHLNDNHRWTREQIADWVETIERREASTAAAAVREDASQPVVPSRAAATSSSVL